MLIFHDYHVATIGNLSAATMYCVNVRATAWSKFESAAGEWSSPICSTTLTSMCMSIEQTVCILHRRPVDQNILGG